MIKLTCQIFLTHQVADFCTLGFAHLPIGPRWPHPRRWPRWFSAYSSLPWRPVTKQTCQIFLTHPVADFYILVLAPLPIGPSWPYTRGQPRLFLAYISDRWGPVIKLTCQIFLTQPVVDFCTLGFATSPIRPKWPHPKRRRRWF